MAKKKPRCDLRPMQAQDWSEVADLVYVSTNYWYETHGRPAIFSGGPEATRLFCEVYEALDPGCCVVAADPGSGRLMGSCFYHPRETHVSLGIMNVHPNYFGRGVAGAMLRFIIDVAQRADQPLRLVSSAVNLDSFSLYSRAGFVPQMMFQDMYLQVPEDGMPGAGDAGRGVRAAVDGDVEAMTELERELCHIARAKDYRYFIDNATGIWRTLVCEDGSGGLSGFLVSVTHPGSNMLGPGVARDEETALALILAQLDRQRGRSPVFLLPVQCSGLVRKLYALGARNCELHVSQVRGQAHPQTGVIMPTFMPETG